MVDASSEVNPPTDRERLRKHFQKFSDGDNTYMQGWDDLWQTGFLPFDRERPSPAIVDTLKSRRELVENSWVIENGTRRRKRALVPGCGRGYDVLLFASCGYDAYGLEASENALKACKEFATKSGDQYPVWNKKVGQGQLHWICGDFFKDDWCRDADGKTLSFDLIYDYTVRIHLQITNWLAALTAAQFLCALSPSLRPNWAFRMSQLLAPPPAVLICLEFPTYKEPSSGGPPFALPSAVYLQHLSRPGETIPYDENGYVIEQASSETNKKALLRIAHWKADRTHKIGEGTDYVSIWRHK
ncbi:MAG: hypothetical protein Q9165_006361 [Trypethelium subeluteriae]